MRSSEKQMSLAERSKPQDGDIYSQLTSARSYLRKVDDFYARAAAEHNTTLEHYQVLLAVHCLSEHPLPLRILAEHLVRDRTATGQLCRRMEQLGLLTLTYESNSHRPQLLASLSERGAEVLQTIMQAGLGKRDDYLRSLSPDKRSYLAEAVRFSWLEGLEPGSDQSRHKKPANHR